VPKTLLAVDDSATMRKVLEISFAGEDFRVVTADQMSGALARMAEEPVVAVIDTSLGSEDGYALAKEVRARSARIAIVLLASRYTPYDPNRGRDAGADDFLDKPFDTQALIDKVKKAILARENVKPVAAAAPAPAPAVPPLHQPNPATATSPMIAPNFGAGSRAPMSPSIASKPSFPTQRTHTLSFEGTPAAPPAVAPPPPQHLTRTAPSGMPAFQMPVAPAPPPAAPQPPTAQPPPAAPTAPAAAAATAAPSAHTVPTAAPPRVAAPEPPPHAAQAAHPAVHSPAAITASPATPAHAPPVPAAAPIAAVVNGSLAGKLGDLGLTPAQVEGVLALSREVVERVVWEVVPQLAETIIKEEIARLTADS
jgi:CheY-like chemotaxis protein